MKCYYVGLKLPGRKTFSFLAESCEFGRYSMYVRFLCR